MSESNHQSTETSAIRVRRLRETLGLTRQKFAQHFAVPPATLQHWETTGLPHNGAKRLVRALESYGVKTTVQWLLFGGDKGEPKFPEDLLHAIIAPTPFKASTDEDAIKQELALFHQLHVGSIYTQIQDDTMLPYYQPGDYVAGIRYYGKHIADQANNKDCIVMTDDARLLVRRVTNSGIVNEFDLHAPHAKIPVDKNVKLHYAAPIIWIRRPHGQGIFQ